MIEHKLGFRRAMTVVMLSLRQLVEKGLERQENMARGFVDLEKALEDWKELFEKHGLIPRRHR